jgi:hypothetical protein
LLPAKTSSRQQDRHRDFVVLWPRPKRRGKSDADCQKGYADMAEDVFEGLKDTREIRAVQSG